MHWTGKTMLMDMFYLATEGIVKHRKRFHFHEVGAGFFGVLYCTKVTLKYVYGVLH